MSALEETIRDLVREEVQKEVKQALARLMTPAEYLSTTEAGELARVAPATIRRWIKDGKITGQRAGREVRVRRTDLEQLLRSDIKPANTDGLTPEELARRDFG